MSQLHQAIAERVNAWREQGYPCPEFPAVGEILDWSREEQTGALRFLRSPQLRALETYWYLRLLEKTPHIMDMYERFFPREDLPALIEALAVPDSAFKASNFDFDRLCQKIAEDDDFVREYRLESLRETMTLSYPSYILALAMGAGKTILIGAIIASEFAMAMEYPEGPFVQNALVFAPGTTIIESLRELAEVPYEKILPPRMASLFDTHLKLTFTRDGEKTIPVTAGSSFNVVVTNTEKIRIQKESVRKSDIGNLFSPEREEEAKAEVANLRLQAIASLPHLAVFSDEAHHTYGQSLGTGLKKVRKTVDYLAEKTNVICVVNTTGTPYFQRQPLRDVIIWYGLSEGIRDGILKDLSGNIQMFHFDRKPAPYLDHVIKDFFSVYGNVKLPNGSPAKLAIYFPQTDDIREFKPVIDKAMMEAGQSPALCLVNTSDESLTKSADIQAFNRLNDPRSTHRVILLVNKGTEGWNCPSLFACALARKLRSSNNFVLQATTRCLRQIPGNTHKARVYLSSDNFGILDKQLRDTYGESISELNRTFGEQLKCKIVLRKLDIPPLVVTKTIRTVMRKNADEKPLKLSRPEDTGESALTRSDFTISESHATYGVLRQIGDTVEISSLPDTCDVYTAACELASRYRLDPWTLLLELRKIYADEDIPIAHIQPLGVQIEKQTCDYEIREDGTVCYTAEIIYPKDKSHPLLSWQHMKSVNPREFGFHYDPYNFDSNPELDFFDKLLQELKIPSDEVEDIYFTGALTDPNKTDFFVEYKDNKGKWRSYTPDFVIRKKPAKGKRRGTGKIIIVEVKADRAEDDPNDGRTGTKAMAVRRWEDLNPDRLKYEMIFASGDSVPNEDFQRVLRLCREQNSSNSEGGK